ncbi:MAG: restriction endonuclease [Solirubrobacteraceae bacterium]
MNSAPGNEKRVARPEQESELERLVLSEGVAVVNVNGAPGSGKSWLARSFADANASWFPGGVVMVYAHKDVFPDYRVFDAIDADRPSLIVLDEIDHADASSLPGELRRLREHRPRAQIITTSCIHVAFGGDTPSIEMPPLSLDDAVRLLAIGQSTSDVARINRLATMLQGNALAVTEVSRRLASGMPVDAILAWLEQRHLAVARDAKGDELPLGSAAREHLDASVKEVSDALIAELAANPELLYGLPSRRFEELVAELYRRRGFEATLTPASGDEGVDVYVVRNEDVGRTLWVVQAKRYAAHNKVGAGVVRELLGTVHAKNASAGMIVTTSFFEPGAVRLERQFEFRIGLRDYFSLQDMLRW